jgi:hypothetical protein
MGAMGGARGAGDSDKDHQRKVTLTETHDEDFDPLPEIIRVGGTED